MSAAAAHRASIVANPVLVGAVTTLVVVVAVFLAYNANNGPAVRPDAQLNVELATARTREGQRGPLGRLPRRRRRRHEARSRCPTAQVGARLHAEARQEVRRDPGRHARSTIRPRSALGLKYVELTRGTSRTTSRTAGRCPSRQTKVPVELDEFYNMFDAPTRKAAGDNLDGFGNALHRPRRRPQRDDRQAPRCFGTASTPVMAQPVGPEDRHPALLQGARRRGAHRRAGLEDERAPVHDDGDTFEAFSRDPQALKDTISKSPADARRGTESLASSARS